MNQHIFGPVPSRRLGLSLGVDLVPYKTCSFDCIYCECGPTTNLTLERKEYVPMDKVISELDNFLSQSPELDYVTFSGAGEATLHSGIGKVLSHIKNNYPKYKTCLLTNGSLLGNDEVIKDLAPLDLVIPSLDAVEDCEFRQINRPAPNLNVEQLFKDLLKYRKNSHSVFWLEIFIVPGINDSQASLEKFAEFAKELKPEKIQLNTLDRPGSVDWIIPADMTCFKKFENALRPFADVEITYKFKQQKKKEAETEDGKKLSNKIMELISRRPCTVEDMAAVLNIEENIVQEQITGLIKHRKIQSEKRERGTFYFTTRS